MTAREELLEWAKSVLGGDARFIAAAAETPFSRVLQIEAAGAVYYLKQTPPALFIEAAVIAACRELCGSDNVPEVVAQDKAMHCFLMRAAGETTLRGHLAGKADLPLLAAGIKSYRNLMQHAAPHTAAFRALGVPDWRPQNLPALFDELLSRQAALRGAGLDESECAMLRRCLPAVTTWSEALAALPVKPVLTHSDFQDNNIVLDTKTRKLTIIDLGETAIEHPFFSLSGCLRRAAGRYGIDVAGPDYAALHDAAFGGWGLDAATREETLRLTEKLWPLPAALGHLRLESASDNLASLPRMRHRLADYMRVLLK